MLAYANVRIDHENREVLEEAKSTIATVMKKTETHPGRNHRYWLRSQAKYAKVLFYLKHVDKALQHINDALEYLPTIYSKGKHVQLAKAYFVKGEILLCMYERDQKPSFLEDAKTNLILAKENYPNNDPVKKVVEKTIEQIEDIKHPGDTWLKRTIQSLFCLKKY